jgi:Ca-activated chloride channel family protein
MGNYNDALMERLADQGDGSYHYVDQLDEARKVFVENLTGTLQHVAKDAKIQVEWNPRAVERWRLLGYENRDVADRDFRNDAVDAGEVGAGQAATALYEVRLRDGVGDAERVATLHVRWKSVDGPSKGQVRELSRELRAGDVDRSLDRGNRDLRLAALSAMFAERLKGTRAGIELSWRELHQRALDLAADAPRDAAVRELTSLVGRAAAIAGDSVDEDRRPGDRERGRDNGRLDERD